MRSLFALVAALILGCVAGNAQALRPDGAADSGQAGNVAQTPPGIQAGKGSLLVDVRAYGASTSSADNYAAIRAAVAFVNTQPAGSVTLYFPPGTYAVDPSNNRTENRLAAITANNVTVTGVGATIALAAGAPMAQRWGVAPGSTVYWNYFVLAGSHDTIDGLTLNSNGMTSWSPGCRGETGCWWATGVYIAQEGGRGVPEDDWVIRDRFLQLYGWAVLSAGNDTRIEGNYAEHSAGMVCQQLVPAGESRGCDIADNTSVDSIDAPYAVNGGSAEGTAVTNFRIENNYAAGNANGSGIDVTAATDGVVEGNVITGMKNWCIQVDRSHGTYRPEPAAYIASQRIQVSGNVCKGNNQYTGWPLNAEIMVGDNYAAPASGPEYAAGKTASEIEVSGNMIAAQNSLGMGVAVGYGASNVTVTGNTITGCGNETIACESDRVYRYYDVGATANIVVTNNHEDTAYAGVVRTNGPGPYEIWGNNMGWDAFSGRPASAPFEANRYGSTAPPGGQPAEGTGANRQGEGRAEVRSCGGTSTCSNTLEANAVLQWGTVGLSAGSATVTGLEPYTSVGSFACIGIDTTAVRPVSVVPASASSIAVTGSGGDTISWECHGN
jgi:hypothetical protein